MLRHADHAALGGRMTRAAAHEETTPRRPDAPVRRPAPAAARDQVDAAPPPAVLRSPAALVALQRAAGNRATAGLVVQRALVNDASWDPVDPVTGQGTRVEAVVGPGYTYGSGPGTQVGFRPYDYTHLFSSATAGAMYCQGHLLNDNLGGPGNPGHANAAQNLTAFPQQPTNGDHKNLIEKFVKTAAKTAWFRYTVRITYGTGSGPRLRHRLHGNLAPATAAGLGPTAATFGYANSLTATWEELQDGPAVTNAGAIAKVGGAAGSLVIQIPSPLSYVAPAKQADEYPGGKGASWSHLPSFKEHQQGATGGALPSTSAKTLPPTLARPHVIPQRWHGIEAARAGMGVAGGANAAWQAGHQHYLDGVTASRNGPASATRLGRGYTTGYADFEAGITHGRANPLASPPASPPAAIVSHGEYWTGVGKGRTTPLATPPTTGRAEIAGHEDFWAGVTHAKSHPLLAAPAGNLGQAEGHRDYWGGVTHARANPQGVVPPGNLGQGGGYDDYWTGAGAALADPTSATPLVLGAAAGHADVLAALTHAQGNPRGTAPANATTVAQLAVAAYWAGVDFARSRPVGDAFVAAPPAAGIGVAGVRAFRDALTLVAHDLPSLAVVPAGGGAREAAADYRTGVEAHLNGTPADHARTAHALGWQAAADGESAGRAGTPATRTDAGYLAGFHHGSGEADARSDRPADVAVGGGGDLSRAGHSGYLAGEAAARADLSSAAPGRPSESRGHAEYLAGVAHARGHARGVAAPGGEAAAVRAVAEYWQGVDHARTTPGPYPTAVSAARAGTEDYAAGVADGEATLAATLAVGPVGGGRGEGLADYRDGATACRAGLPADPARSGAATAWQACQDGLTAGAAALDATSQPPRIEGAYLVGFLHAYGAVHARAGRAVPTPGAGGDGVAAEGHGAYGAGLASARNDLAAPPPAGPVEGLGHAEYLAGVAAARSADRSSPPAADSQARTAAWSEYWLGADAARTVFDDAGAAASAGRAGAADYRAGADHAASTLDALADVEPAGGARHEGFVDYRDGVEACKAGGPPVPSRSGHQRGWQACADGMPAGDDVAGTPAPLRTDAGYLSGFHHARGGALARSGQADPGGASAAEQLGSGGHAEFLGGAVSARSDAAGAAPARVLAARGHGDYRTGVAAAASHPRDADAPTDSTAAAQGWRDYWAGVDLVRANPTTAIATAATHGAGGAQGADDYRAGLLHGAAHAAGALPAQSGAVEGAQDVWAGEQATVAAQPGTAPPGWLTPIGQTVFAAYWTGVAQARSGLAGFKGAPPTGRVTLLGFATYRDGALAAARDEVNDLTRPAFALGWADGDAGRLDARNGVAPAQPHGGYLRAHEMTPRAPVKRSGDPLESDRHGPGDQ